MDSKCNVTVQTSTVPEEFSCRMHEIPEDLGAKLTVDIFIILKYDKDNQNISNCNMSQSEPPQRLRLCGGSFGLTVFFISI